MDDELNDCDACGAPTNGTNDYCFLCSRAEDLALGAGSQPDHDDFEPDIDHFHVGDLVRRLDSWESRYTVERIDHDPMTGTDIPTVFAGSYNWSPELLCHVCGCDPCNAYSDRYDEREAVYDRQLRATYTPAAKVLADDLLALLTQGAEYGRELTPLPDWFRDAIADDLLELPEAPWPEFVTVVDSKADWPTLLDAHDDLVLDPDIDANNGPNWDGVRKAYDIIRTAHGIPLMYACFAITPTGQISLFPRILTAAGNVDRTALTEAVDQALTNAGRPPHQLHVDDPHAWWITC